MVLRHELKYARCLYSLMKECSKELVCWQRLGFVGLSLRLKMYVVSWDVEYRSITLPKPSEDNEDCCVKVLLVFRFLLRDIWYLFVDIIAIRVVCVKIITVVIAIDLMFLREKGWIRNSHCAVSSVLPCPGAAPAAGLWVRSFSRLSVCDLLPLEAHQEQKSLFICPTVTGQFQHFIAEIRSVHCFDAPWYKIASAVQANTII